MIATNGRNTTGTYWMAIVITFGLLYLNGIVTAQPGFDRVKREDTVGVYDALFNFARMGEKDIVAQMNEEVSGTTKERHKRLSDQRRAELETLIALSKMTEKFVNVVRGGRHLETNKTGRKKRAVFDLNVENLQKLFRLSAKLGLKGNAAYPVVS